MRFFSFPPSRAGLPEFSIFDLIGVIGVYRRFLFH